jgi:hypothetical protein
MQRKPWHSKEPQTEVYHDNDDCTEGNNIESRNMQSGTGTRLRKCAHCARLGRKK